MLQPKNLANNINTIKLADIIDIQFLQRFQDDFATCMGVASVTVDVNGIPITKPSKYTPFCQDYTHSTACGDKRCAESHRYGGEQAARAGKPVIYECHAGLIDFAAPIILKGKLLGTILGGQVLIHKPPAQKYRKIAREIGVNEAEYVQAVRKIIRLTPERIEAAANVLYNVANCLSESAYQKKDLIETTDVLNRNLDKVSSIADRLNIIGEMAASIGHEIRNPMTTVRGYLQFLQRKEIFANYSGQFSIMIDELDRANGIITEFLSLAKNKAIHMKPGNINDVIHSLQPLLQADALCRGHELIIELDKIGNNIFDEKELRQMILNLVRNGFEAMPNKGTLWLRTFIKNDYTIISVKDTGKGIPDLVMQKLGTPFVTTKEFGTGLGLPICYRIAERHGASIEIDSTDAGTTINVIFKS